MPEISVIVPVYQTEAFLGRCVDSILGQTFADFELILVDDGSSDNCGAICDAYAAKDSRVVVIHQENSGLSAARNAGIDWAFAHSESRWIAFVDSDDWVHPQYLELLHTAAMKQNTAVAACAIQKTDAFGTFRPITAPKLDVKKPEDIYVYREGSCGGVFAVVYLYQKTLFQDVRYPIGKLWEDRATTYKLLFQTDRIATVEEELYFYFYNPDSITQAAWKLKNLDVLEALEENLVFFGDSAYQAIMEDTVKTYAVTIACQYGELQKSALAKQEKRKRGYELKKKLVCAYWKYRSMGIFSSEDVWILYMVFPKIMQVWTLCKSAVKKLRSKIKQFSGKE